MLTPDEGTGPGERAGQLTDVADPDIERVVRGRRVTYAVMSLVLATIIGLAVADGLGLADVYGVDTATVEARGGGSELAVVHATVSRPGLATPFGITVTRAGGFDRPVEVGVSASYLQMWDENGFSPAPSSETTRGEWLVWEFEPPDGETLTIDFDARIEPAVQSGRSGQVALFDDGEVVAEVAFRTRVMP